MRRHMVTTMYNNQNNRAWPTTQALSFSSLPVLKCSVVPYCTERIEGRGTQIESDECC